MKLVKPSEEFKDSFIESAAEIIAEGNENFLKGSNGAGDFRAYCQRLNNEAKGIGLKEGLVPSTYFWLTDNNCFIGRSSVRHWLNENLFKFGGHIGYIIAPKYRKLGYGTQILELSLREAHKLGIDKVLVTCNNTNLGSARIIEKNGGVFENELFQPETGFWKRRYWISRRE